MATYTVERITDYSDLTVQEIDCFARGAARLSMLYGQEDVTGFPMQSAIEKGVTLFCYRDGVPVGFLIATLNPYIFNPHKKMLRQETFWAEPYTRASWHLLNEFVDFGKRNADYVITMIARHTNLTPRNLKRLGFSELETIYRMEV